MYSHLLLVNRYQAKGPSIDVVRAGCLAGWLDCSKVTPETWKTWISLASS